MQETNPINETAARRAHDANSFRTFEPGRATSEYWEYVTEAREIALAQKERVDPIHHDKIDYWLDVYKRRLAEVLNRGYEIDARVPSIMIAGPSRFPIRAKEKQNAARAKNMQEWREVEAILDKIRGIGTGGISSDDPDAVAKLKEKLLKAETLQNFMKDARAHYRKNETMAGFVADDEAQRWDTEIAAGRFGSPFAEWQLQNNNAEINRIRQRIAKLEKQAALSVAAASRPGHEGYQFDGGEVIYNYAMNRLQIKFADKPDEAMRGKLKHNGFKWAPSQEAWQRQLTDNAKGAAKRLFTPICK